MDMILALGSTISYAKVPNNDISMIALGQEVIYGIGKEISRVKGTVAATIATDFESLDWA